MTSREHARRLMLILLSSQAGPAAGAGSKDERTSEPTDDRQAPEGRDDSTDKEERWTKARVDELMLI